MTHSGQHEDVTDGAVIVVERAVPVSIIANGKEKGRLYDAADGAGRGE